MRIALIAVTVLAWLPSPHSSHHRCQYKTDRSSRCGPAPRPERMGTADADIPAITVYLPRTMARGTPAMIVCPGGGYGALAANHEGRQVANYLNSLGMAAFVLRYRLGPRYHHPVQLGDAQRAIRTVRAKARGVADRSGAHRRSWVSPPAATWR